MKKALGIICGLFLTAPAFAIPIVAQEKPQLYDDTSRDTQLSREKPFYIKGDYVYSMWSDGSENGAVFKGDSTTSFGIALGARVMDTFRMEANYYNLAAKWDGFKIDGSALFINAILDGRIDGMYRGYTHQFLVPYVGFGLGMTWLNSDDVIISNEAAPAFAGLAGVAVEFNDSFAIDFGYQYIYITSPKIVGATDYTPTAHQFRVGARVFF